MKEHILNIQLMKNLTLRCSKRQYQSYTSWLDNQTKSVIIINFKFLLETLGNQTSPMTIQFLLGM
jgi:hypothetical protein